MRYPDFDSLRSDYFRSVVSGHVNSAISLGYLDISVDTGPVCETD